MEKFAAHYRQRQASCAIEIMPDMMVKHYGGFCRAIKQRSQHRRSTYFAKRAIKAAQPAIFC